MGRVAAIWFHFEYHLAWEDESIRRQFLQSPNLIVEQGIDFELYCRPLKLAEGTIDRIVIVIGGWNFSRRYIREWRRCGRVVM